jgi:SAM-dependent methyltransferase
VDSDPLLLALGRARYGDAVRFVDADLTGAWQDQVPGVLDAAVSTTALHWLDPDPLAGVYRGLASRLRPGGVFVDGDHFTHGDPAIDELLTEVRKARTARAGMTDREDWTTWWTAAGEDPALASLIGQRSARAIAHHGSNKLSVGEHEALLRAAGFTSTGTVWQSGDDFVLVAIR